MNTAAFTFSDEELRKLAQEMLRDPFRAPMKSAQAALGEDPALVGKCLYAVSEVVFDQRYLVIFAEEQAKGVGVEVIPTKEQTLKRLWQVTDQGMVSDRIKALELFCKVAGYLDTGGKGANVVINPSVHVMEVPVSTNNDDWEKALKAQQEKLMQNAATH